MRVTTSKSKNSESFYITQSYTNAQGKSTSKTIRKLGTLAELSERLGTDRDGVMAWANEQAHLETLKYKSEKEDAVVMIPFHSNKLMDYHKQKLFNGGYLFLQSIYYGLRMDAICRKIKNRYKFEYDLNAILSDLIYTRVLEPSSKKSSFRAAKQFLASYSKSEKTPGSDGTANTMISGLPGTTELTTTFSSCKINFGRLSFRSR